MKRGQITVPAMDPKGKYGQCDVLDLDEQSFRVFLCNFLMQAGAISYIDGNSPKLRGRPEIPLMAKAGVSFALDKDKKP